MTEDEEEFCNEIANECMIDALRDSGMDEEEIELIIDSMDV